MNIVYLIKIVVTLRINHPKSLKTGGAISLELFYFIVKGCARHRFSVQFQ